MARRISGRRRILLARTVHPEYRAVVDTITRHQDLTIQTVGHGGNGCLDLGELETRLGEDVGALVVQSPNFLGNLEPLGVLADRCRRQGVLLVVNIAELLSLGIVQPPGWAGADIGVRRSSVSGNFTRLRRSPRGFSFDSTAVCQESAGPAGRPDGGQTRSAWICADPCDPGTAHSTRKSHLQHLHQPEPDCIDGDHVLFPAGPEGNPGVGHPERRQGSIRACRSEKASC